MRVEVAYLFQRQGRLYFRRRVPDDLRDIIGQREWKVSLGLKVGSELDAISEVRRLTRDTDRMIRDAERQTASGLTTAELAARTADWARRNGLLAGGDGRMSAPGELSLLDHEIEAILRTALRRARKNFEEDLTDQDFSAEERMKLSTLREGQPVEVPCTLEMAAENYRKHHKRGEMAKAEQVAVAQWLEHAGDKPLADIRRREVREWITLLMDERGQKVSTVKRRLSSLTAIANCAIEDFDLQIRNPFEKQKLPKGASGSSVDCIPFHTSHLKLIRRHIAESRLMKAETKVLLQLLEGTTCGPSEVAGLDWIDVQLDADIPYIKIRPNDHRSLKTESRPRDFPLVGAALDAMKLWRKMHLKASGPVFGERARDQGALSQRLNRAIRSAGVPHSPHRLVAYSYRHTFEEAMRVAGVEPDLQRYLMGHGEQSTTDRYGASRPFIERLCGSVTKTIPHLGENDPSNYRQGELPTGH